MSDASGNTERRHPIGSNERSGVLHPRNLRRYDARWFDPAPAIGAVVDHYWHVHWNLPVGESIDQRIIDFPAVTLSIEEGEVPAPCVATGLHTSAWQRRIAGTGSVFAIRLRPAGLRTLSDLTPQQLADRTLPVTRDIDPQLHCLLSQIADAPTPEERAKVADQVIQERLSERPLRPSLLLANAVVTELSSGIRDRAGTSLADTFGVSERTIQRALRTTLGRGPKWVTKRIRLQEVARSLTSSDIDLAELASELGYADQSHLTADFRSTAGTTPGAYARELRNLIE